MNDYLTIKQVAERWNITPRRIQKMCADGRISGAIKFGRDWAIPQDVDKPVDKKGYIWRIQKLEEAYRTN